MIANYQAGNILLIEYYFSCDSFDCELWKNSQFAIKRISQSKPDLRYIKRAYNVTYLIKIIVSNITYSVVCINILHMELQK